MNYIFFQYMLYISLLSGLATPAFSMEKSALKKEKKTNNYQVLGFSHEHLTNVKAEASLYLELYKHYSAIVQYTHEMKDYLSDNHYYTGGFEYTDNSSSAKHGSKDSKMPEALSNQEISQAADKYTLTSGEGKAALLQAKNLLKIKDLNFVDICDLDLKNNSLKAEQFFKKTQSFIALLVSSQNPELEMIGKWLKFSLANKKRNRYFNSLQEFRNSCIYNDNLPQNLKPVLNKFTLVTQLMVELTKIALCNFNNYEAQKEFADHLASIFDSTELNDKYIMLRKELFAYLSNKKIKNRRELIKKHGTPLFQQTGHEAAFPTDLFSKKSESEKTCPSLVDTKMEANEWIPSSKKSKGKRKNNPSTAQKKKTAKKISQQANFIKQATIISDSKEKELVKEKTVLSNSNPNLTIFKPSLYDSRVLEWFSEQIKEKADYNNRSMLYHTFPFIADHFIFKYGVTKERKNRSNPAQKDTVFYMGGEIQYKKGKKAGQRETVLFTCCKDPRGICYHRGFERKESSLFEEFESNEFKYQFPALCDGQLFEEKIITLDINDEIHRSKCRENYFCIEIDDNRNGVTLVLYKSNFQEEKDNFVS